VKATIVAALIISFAACGSVQTPRSQPGNSGTLYVADLGPGIADFDQVSLKYSVRFNTRGFDKLSDKARAKAVERLRAAGAPGYVIERARNFPEAAMGQWIDSAIDQARAPFLACGGSITQKAAAADPSEVYVQLEPTPFPEPFGRGDVVGYYYEKRIEAVAFYWDPHQQWLRHCQYILVWEFGNYYSVKGGVQAEDANARRPAGWPCQAPPLGR
jgi:hypothetical protein